MGLLDEAIREHLELKRRHGADPGEVARLEHEALGPAPDEPEEQDDAAPAAPQAAIEQPADEPAAPAAEPEPVELDQPTQRFASPDTEPVAERPRHDDEPDEDDADEPAAAEIVPADEEPGADDVLEETPEFLQETPEHDRLWFEQKPPRDFDF